MRRTILCVALTASAFLGATHAALAEDGQMRVNLAGVDLASSDGAKAALGRIRYQAATFCEAGTGVVSLARSALVTECQSAMEGKAVDQLNAPVVSALYGRTPAQMARMMTLAKQ
ncbi:MAG: hypothetical protein JWQ97_4048 [Phenylobacterium sp.]|nr:hypothetical protein [Phenylobacterium sp.]